MSGSMNAWVAAYERGDARAVADLFTKDGIYAANTGELLRGREEIRQAVDRWIARRPDVFFRLGVERDAVLDLEVEPHAASPLPRQLVQVGRKRLLAPRPLVRYSQHGGVSFPRPHSRDSRERLLPSRGRVRRLFHPLNSPRSTTFEDNSGLAPGPWSQRQKVDTQSGSHLPIGKDKTGYFVGMRVLVGVASPRAASQLARGNNPT